MVQTAKEDGTDLEDAQLKEFFSKSTLRKRKDPLTLDTGGSKKSRINKEEEEGEKNVQRFAVGGPLDAFRNFGES